MNECHFLGNLVKDPEVRYLPSGTAVLTFRLAINRRFKKGDGTWGRDTAFIKCEAWDTGAKIIGEHFKKGKPIIVHACVKNDSWVDKEGNKKEETVFRVTNFEFVPLSKKDTETEEVSTEELYDGEDDAAF